MKRLFLIISILAMFCGAGSAQVAVSTVRSYGENLRMWGVTNNIAYRENIEALCSGKKKTRVSDKIAMTLAAQNAQESNSSYTLDSYLNWIFKAMLDGKLNVEVSDFELLSPDRIKVVGNKNYNYAGNLEYVVCKLSLTGTVNCSTSDIMYLEKGKIVKIGEAEDFVDKKGKKKVLIDLSDIEIADNSVGLMYNYGAHLPYGLSVIYSFPWISISSDFSFAYKGSVAYTSGDVKDIMNYTLTNTTLKPKLTATITPSLNLNWVSIGCGAGILYLEKTENQTYSEYTQNGSSVNYRYGTTTGKTKDVCKFLLRPVVRGFIPLDGYGDICLSVAVGYDYAFGYKKCNGFNFGLGIQVATDW